MFNRHTSYEWALQLALERVEPYGEDRADMRAAWMTSQRIASDRSERMGVFEFRKLFSGLMTYLLCKRNDDEDDE